MTNAALDDFRTARIPDRLKAALVFLEVMTLRPEELSAQHVRTARAGGVSDAALREAFDVAYVFNWIDGVADALGFHVQTAEQFASDAKVLLSRGYRCRAQAARARGVNASGLASNGHRGARWTNDDSRGYAVAEDRS